MDDTTDEWATLRERLVAAHGNERAALMICALVRDDPVRACQGRVVGLAIDSSGSNTSTDPQNLRITAGQSLASALASVADAGADGVPDLLTVIDFDSSSRVLFAPGDPDAAIPAIAGIDSRALPRPRLAGIARPPVTVAGTVGVSLSPRFRGSTRVIPRNRALYLRWRIRVRGAGGVDLRIAGPGGYRRTISGRVTKGQKVLAARLFQRRSPPGAVAHRSDVEQARRLLGDRPDAASHHRRSPARGILSRVRRRAYGEP